MFKAPVSTIRDVVELTEASPNLVARLLGEIRGPGEYEKLVDRLNAHESRISRTEAAVAALKSRPPVLSTVDKQAQSKVLRTILSLVGLLGLLYFIAYFAISSGHRGPKMIGQMNGHGRALEIDESGTVYENKDGKHIPIPENDPDALTMKSMALMSQQRGTGAQ